MSLYKLLSKYEQDCKILQIRSEIVKKKFKPSGRYRLKDWEIGWKENLEELQTFFHTDLLLPKYHKHNIFRRCGRYIIAYDSHYEKIIGDEIKQNLFTKYCQKATRIVEFGCGTGYNLILANLINSNCKLIGADWTNTSQNILDIINKKLNLNIEPVNFDFFQPNKSGFKLTNEDVVITIHALEQVGLHFGNFLQYLFEYKPKLCLHIEPIFELYDINNNFDKVAMEYHQQRNYLTGFLPALQELSYKKQIDILFCKRYHFGSLYHEGYSVVVWKFQ